jgi:hypothetical protein
MLCAACVRRCACSHAVTVRCCRGSARRFASARGLCLHATLSDVKFFYSQYVGRKRMLLVLCCNGCAQCTCGRCSVVTAPTAVLPLRRALSSQPQGSVRSGRACVRGDVFSCVLQVLEHLQQPTHRQHSVDTGQSDSTIVSTAWGCVCDCVWFSAGGVYGSRSCVPCCVLCACVG